MALMENMVNSLKFFQKLIENLSISFSYTPGINTVLWCGIAENWKLEILSIENFSSLIVNNWILVNVFQSGQ